MVTSKNVKRGSYKVYIYISTHPPLFNISLSVCLSVFLAHPPTKPLSFISSMVVSPSLIFRGQGRDVHPQLLVSQRQTQELRLDNQLRTSILLFGQRYIHTLTHTWTIRWMPLVYCIVTYGCSSQFSFNSKTAESEW